MRRTALGTTLATAALSLFGCRDGDNPVQPQGPEIVPPPALDIVDGSSDGGNAGILFRLPIKVAGRVPGTFDPSVPLRMEIRELGSDAPPEEYTVAAGDIDVRKHLRSYVLLWRPPDHAPAGTVYRVSLYAGALDLHAWADLEVAYRIRDALRIIAKGENALLLGQLDRYPIRVYVNTDAVQLAETQQAEDLEEEPGVVDASVTLVQNDEGGSGEVFNTSDPDAPLAAQVTTQAGQAVDASGNPVSDYVLTMVLHENDYDPLPGVSPNFQFPFFFTGSATTSTGEPVFFTTVEGQVGAEVLICQPLDIHEQLADPQLNAQKIFQYDEGSTQLHETAVGDPRCEGYLPPEPVSLSLGSGLAHDLLTLGRRGLRRMTALLRPTPLMASHGGLRTLPTSGALNLSDWGAILATDPAVSTATVPDGTVGSPTEISIQAMVEPGVPQILGGDQVQVEASGANSATLTVGDGVTDNGDGTYTATYTPTTGGTDQVTITIVDPETATPQPIAGSPFTSSVVDATPVLLPAELCSDYPATAITTFADANLEGAVRSALGVGAEDDLTCGLLATLTVLTAYDAGITTLAGIQNLMSLTLLDLTNNAISDISALSGLTNLTNLTLVHNSISDISALSGLANLTFLDLSYNTLSEIGTLSDLTAIEYLSLSGNTLSDISALSGLTHLTHLGLNLTTIADISSLGGLTSLTYLGLNSNTIADIGPVSALTSLSQLLLAGNELSDISALSGLTDLGRLVLNGNSITDISALSGLMSLYSLYLLDNPSLSNIQPLLDNTGLGAGDEVGLSGTAVGCPDVAALKARGATVTSSCPAGYPLGATEIVFDFDLSSLSPGPPYDNIQFSGVFEASDPVSGGDVFITNVYGDLDGTDLVQTRDDTSILTGGGTIYGPLTTANPLFDPMLDGAFSFGLRMNSGTATLQSFTACGVKGGEVACITR